MAYFIRNNDDPTATKTPAPVYTHETQNIVNAFLSMILGNAGGEMQISELLQLVPEELSAADRNLLNRIADYLVDFTIINQEVWNTATDAQLVGLDPNETSATQAIGLLAAGSVPTLTGWATELAPTENRVIIARIPLANNAEDYRIHIVQGSSTTDQRLQYLPERARNSQYKFISSLRSERPGTFTAQHHGTIHHTQYNGQIGEKGIEQAQALVDALSDAIMERLLPSATGGSVGQIAKIIEQSGKKLWAIGDDERGTGGGGLSAAEQAKIDAIATPPAEGARDTKGLIYEGDRTAWIIFDYLTRSEFRDYRPHTPDRGPTLPAHLLPQGTYVLEKTSHWSDKFYRFYPVWRNININGQSHRDIGTIEIPISSEWTVFEDDDNPNPAIFNASRVAGMVYRQTSGPVTGYRWYPKIIMDRALFPNSGGAYDYSGLSIRMRTDFGSHFDTQLFQTTFDADDQTGSVTEIVAGGKTYVCFRPNPNAVDARTIFDNVVTNDTWLSFQILKSKSASPVFPPTDPQFLSDDPATPWVDGEEYESALYEGDANGHPQKRILPPLDVWNAILARINTYITRSDPDSRAGTDGQFWFNVISGKIWQKQSGTWTLIADLVTQAELNAVIAGVSGGNIENWDDITLNTQIGAGTMVQDDNLFYISWTAHRKGSLPPARDSGNWRLITTYIGGWRSGTYPAGVLTFRGGNFYVSIRDIVPGNPSPTGSSGSTYWQQLDVQSEPARYLELTINSGIAIPEPNAAAAPLTFNATELQNVNNAGFLTRNSAGDGITLKAGTYELNTHLEINASTINKRATITLEIYDGTSVLSERKYVDYIRNFNVAVQSVDSFHKINLTTDKTVQIRVKATAGERNDASTLGMTTNGGSVVISRV